MSDCKRTHGLVGRVVDQSAPTLVVGADLYVTTQLRLNETREEASFVGFAGATAMFPGVGGTPVVSIGQLVSADLATVKFTIPASGSVSLAPGDPVSFQQYVQDARGRSIVIFEEALTIAASLF